MSRKFHIFVDTKLDQAEFTKEFTLISGLILNHKPDEYGGRYETQQPEFLLDLSTHDFDNDRNLNFEAYRYDVRLIPFGITSDQEWSNFLAKVVRPLYLKMKAAGDFSLMLVDDLQAKLEEFNPQLSTTR